MDCYYHHAVPSVALCLGCKQPICATCRSAEGDCPGCRLAARIDAAAGARELGGRVPPRSDRYGPVPGPAAQPDPPPRSTAVAMVRPESRALVALGYPFWPLAVLALFDASRSPFVRRQAIQALGFNFGMAAFGAFLTFAASLPFVGLGAWPLLGMIVPVMLVASVVYAIKVWQGEDVHVPIIGDFVDAKIHA